MYRMKNVVASTLLTSSVLLTTGCATHQIEVEVDGQIVRVKFKITPIESCGQGATPLGYIEHEGKSYRAFDTDGDGCVDCVTRNGQAFAITVIASDGDPCKLVVTPEPTVSLPSELPTESETANLMVVPERVINTSSLNWSNEFIAKEAIEILSFNPATGEVDMQLGFEPGTYLALGEGLESAFALVHSKSGEQVSLYRLRGHVSEIYWLMQDSFGGEHPLDFTIETEFGRFSFDGEVGDRLDILWQDVVVHSERRRQ